MLDLKEISYQPQTGERKIIDNLNLKVHENEIILICGNSGSGKTTLLEIISGLTTPQNHLLCLEDKILFFQEIFPFWGFVNPLIISSKVVFPEPLFPQIKMISFS